MPETPRTVGERATELFEEYPGTPWEECVYAAAQKLGVMDALIGCQGRVVYTEESLLAAGHAYEDAHRAALDTNDYEAGLIAGTRAAITAAGGVVADEVVVNALHVGLGTLPDGSTEVHEGDILYIVRAKEE